MRAGGGCDGGARLDISDTMWTELAHVPRLGQVTLVRWTGVLEMPWSGRCFSGPGVDAAVDAVDAEGVCGASSSGAGCPTGAFFPDEVPRAGWAGPGLVWMWRGRVCGLRGVSALSGDRKGGRGWDAVDGMSWIVSSRTLGRCESLGFFAVAWSLVLRCSRVAVRALSALPAWLVAFRRFRVRVWGLVSRGAGVPRATK